MKVTRDDIQLYLKKNDLNAKAISVNPKDIVFEERVKLNCFYCEKYSVNWRCPPKIPNINYEKIMSEFENAAFIYVDTPLADVNFTDARNESAINLHKQILEIEKYLLSMDVPMCLSYIGGSCRLCKSGCGKDRCNNPYLARIPLEATGVNVVESARKYGISIEFPVKEFLIRIGLILW